MKSNIDETEIVFCCNCCYRSLNIKIGAFMCLSKDTVRTNYVTGERTNNYCEQINTIGRCLWYKNSEDIK